MATKIELIVGLGNPGAEYAATRHNVGFWFVDLLAAEHGGHFSANRKLKGDTAEVTIAGHKLRLLKPGTYMNLSGESVGAAAHYFKIPVEHLLVAYDELDLTQGRVQLKFDGGAAGHNGVSSVIEHLGPKFWRLRFGVGHPRDREPAEGGRKRVVDHLLKRAAANDEAAIRETLQEAAAILPVLLEQGAERAKNRLHTRKETK
ncbi:MAG TPA: aminoacyl-tRNA hydrolase [Gammaproteobacteria bacterium]|jgi:PTH1 family peptidyl-tRNA hydrolase|nr:aminoacyl-tRNA hydrolase [Gammaproteobacteria bacterium]